MIEHTGLDFTPEPFFLPAVPCGKYRVQAISGAEYVFTFRRIPRAAKHTGKFGLFWKSPDEGTVLIGLYDHVTGKITRSDKIHEHDGPFKLFSAELREPAEWSCAWCGRKVLVTPVDNTMAYIHQQCRKKVGLP